LLKMFLFCAGVVLLPGVLAPNPGGHHPMPCDYLAKQVEMLQGDLDAITCATDSDMTSVCDEIGKAIPACMGTKGDSNAAQDSCMENIAARVIAASKDSDLSGHEVLECCKEMKYTQFLNLMQGAYSTACPAKTATARRRRSLYPGPGYGLDTIWFQYHLCHDLDFNCWFFTQGWGQQDFGNYYLYENVLGDDGLDLDNDFLTLALLGGGLGSGGGGHYGSAGYPSRYRRSEEDDEEYDEDESPKEDEDYDDDEDDDDDRNDDCKLRLDGYCVDEMPPEARKGRFFKAWIKGIFTSLGITLPHLPTIPGLPAWMGTAGSMNATSPANMTSPLNITAKLPFLG